MDLFVLVGQCGPDTAVVNLSNQWLVPHERHIAPKTISLAIRCSHQIDASGFEIRIELDDPIALREYRHPRNHSNIVASVHNLVHLTGGLDEGTAGRLFLQGALARPNDMLLRQSTARENDIAHSLVKVPRDGFAGVQRECLGLDSGRNEPGPKPPKS